MLRVVGALCGQDYLADVLSRLNESVRAAERLTPVVARPFPLERNDLDHLPDRGSGYITDARYLDAMVVLAPAAAKGKVWADRALAGFVNK